MSRDTLPFVLGFCRGLAAGLAVLALLLVSSARADSYTGLPTWRRAVVADDVAITVHVVALDELIRMQTGKRRDVRNVRATEHRGLAKLYRNTATGEWTCHVYVSANAGADTLEHEAKHCHGWVHE